LIKTIITNIEDLLEDLSSQNVEGSGEDAASLTVSLISFYEHLLNEEDPELLGPEADREDTIETITNEIGDAIQALVTSDYQFTDFDTFVKDIIMDTIDVDSLTELIEENTRFEIYSSIGKGLLKRDLQNLIG